MIRYVLGLETEPAVSVSGNTGIGVVRFKEGRPLLTAVNDTCYLEAANQIDRHLLSALLRDQLRHNKYCPLR